MIYYLLIIYCLCSTYHQSTHSHYFSSIYSLSLPPLSSVFGTFGDGRSVFVHASLFPAHWGSMQFYWAEFNPKSQQTSLSFSATIHSAALTKQSKPFIWWKEATGNSFCLLSQSYYQEHPGIVGSSCAAIAPARLRLLGRLSLCIAPLPVLAEFPPSSWLLQLDSWPATVSPHNILRKFARTPDTKLDEEARLHFLAGINHL